MKLSPQERQRRSDLARRLHAEGRLGGRAPARRSAEVRARRASVLAAELVERHRTRVERALVAGLESENVRDRLKAAELLLKMGLSAERLDAGEAKAQTEHMDREQLLDVLAAKLAGPSMAGVLIRQRLEAADVVDAEVVSES